MAASSGKYPAVLDEVYSPNYRDVQRKFELLAELYELPRITFSLKVQDRDYYNYTTTIENFVVLVLYTQSRRIFLHTGADNSGVEYYLPAALIGAGESIENRISLLAQKAIPNSEIVGIEPVAILDHDFEYEGPEGTDRHSMTGVAYVARIMNMRELVEEKMLADGAFFHFADARKHVKAKSIRKYSNAEVVVASLDRLEEMFQLRVRPPDREIQENKQAFGRYKFHERFVKPVLRLLKKAKSLDHEIMSAIGTPQRFLDASCGDSKIVLNVVRQGATLCVGNDVSWSQITLLLPQLSLEDRFKVIFTNHNLVFLPYRDAIFDVALCKNTLHHLQAPTEFTLALNSLLRVARKVVLMDVEHPHGRFFHRVINMYYERFLHDAGDHFFTERQFREAVENVASSAQCATRFYKFQSLHANYLFAEITRS